MNDCERFETHLSAWLDDELQRVEQLELLDHLVRCTSCRTFTIQARSLEGLIATVRPPRDGVEPSPDLWRNIQRSATIPSSAAATPRSNWSAGWRAAAVLILSIGLGVLFLGGPASVNPGVADAEIRLGEDPDGMDDSRFMALTTEVLRADPRYHAALYRVMEQVVRESDAGETTTEYYDYDDAGEEPALAEIANRNPV